MSKQTNKPQRKVQIFSFIMLLIMIFAVGGFAFLNSGGINHSQDTSQNTNLAFQQFQDQNSGQVFYGAIVNSERFIFLDIEGFEENLEAKEKAEILRSENYWDIYLDSDYVDGNGPFLVEEKMKGAFGTLSGRVENLSCENPTIIFTNKNDTLGEEKCLVLFFNEGEEGRGVDNIAYFLVK